MSETSEEKSLPASERKLREARRKGQVARSQDLVSGFAILAATVFLAFAASGIAARMEELIELGARSQAEPFAVAWPRLFEAATRVLMDATLPLLAAIVAVVVLANAGAMKGLVVSAEPLVPRFEKIDPAKGFKRVFSMRGVVEFLKGVAKLAALALAFVAVFRLGLRDLFNAPFCGAPCLVASARAMLLPMAVTAVIAFLLVGVADVLLQNWLFRREMRMTKTERKRELRDSEGDPAIRRERARERAAARLVSARTGLEGASILIGHANGPVAGLRYKRGETPVPMLVCQANGEEARTMLAEAARRGIPVVRDDPLAEALARGARPGGPIPERAFQPVADHLVIAGLI